MRIGPNPGEMELQRIIRAQLTAIRQLSPQEVHSTVFALQRIILQHYCIALAEWLIRRCNDSNIELSPAINFEQLRRPADGSLVALACDLTAAADNAGWRGLSRSIWTAFDMARPCARLLESERPDVDGLLNAQVRRRNGGVAGHGLPGGYDTPAELDAVELVLDRLSPALPILQSTTDKLIVSPPGSPSFDLKLLRARDRNLICYRQIVPRTGGRCRIQAQVQVSLSDRDDFDYETDDVLSLAPGLRSRLIEATETADIEWRPLAAVPDRQTETFAGRAQEIEEVGDWFDDSGSRACVVYGDGGIGKTTFAIECLHRLLERRINASWKPDLISYYTAKRTRWGIGGLEVINPATAGASDSLLALKRALEGPNIEREWFTVTPDKLPQRLATLLQEYGIQRQNHLMIIDNSETLAQSEEEVRMLSKSIRDICRYVGRVLITSRRKEDIEARYVELGALGEDESEQIIRARGRELGIKHIEQAGGSSLRHYARKMGCKPLVLEVFVQLLTEPATSLERAFGRVMQMQTQDLGEFLYADAWQRLSPDMKHLLLLMTRVADVHDEVLLKLCASEVKVSVLEAYRAIDESRGIASVSRQQGVTEVTFLPEFRRFCSERTVRIDGREVPSESAEATVRRRYAHFLSSSTRQVRDRMEQAFRHPLARAAYRAVADGSHQDAELFYELATLSDPTNAALLDRYAYYLSSRKQQGLALERAVKATATDPSEAEFWLTRGIIESKSNLPEEALASLSRAEKLGKPSHICALHKAHAYMKLTPPDYANARAAVREAQKVPAGESYRAKHLADVLQISKKIEQLTVT